MNYCELKSAIKAAGDNPPQEFWDSLLVQIKKMDGNEKNRASGTYFVHKHIGALKELAKGEPDEKE